MTNTIGQREKLEAAITRLTKATANPATISFDVTSRQMNGDIRTVLAALSSPPAGEGEPVAIHPATSDLVDRFASALKDKLAKAEAKYGYSDGWLSDDWAANLRSKLAEHVQKGDPRDVAAYCAFAWHHGWSIAPRKTRSPDSLNALDFYGDRGARSLLSSAAVPHPPSPGVEKTGERELIARIIAPGLRWSLQAVVEEVTAMRERSGKTDWETTIERAATYRFGLHEGARNEALAKADAILALSPTNGGAGPDVAKTVAKHLIELEDAMLRNDADMQLRDHEGPSPRELASRLFGRPLTDEEEGFPPAAPSSPENIGGAADAG